MDDARAAAARPVIQFVSLVVVLVAILVPNSGEVLGETGLDATIYPWWVLVIAALAAGISLLCAVLPRKAAAGQVVVAITAATLAGHGVVGWKHWEPAVGIGMTYAGTFAEGERMALVIAVAAVVCWALAVWQLVVLSEFPARGSARRPASIRLVSSVLAVVLLVGVSVAMAVPAVDDRDVTSVGAHALLYGLPWAGGVLVSGWLGRTSALVALGTVGVLASLLLIGPGMANLGGELGERLGASLALLVVLAGIVVQWRSAQEGGEVADELHLGRAGS